MDVGNQLSHAYILVERMLTGEIALEDFVSSGETKARFRPDVENAIHRAHWPSSLEIVRVLVRCVRRSCHGFRQGQAVRKDLVCDIGLCGS